MSVELLIQKFADPWMAAAMALGGLLASLLWWWYARASRRRVRATAEAAADQAEERLREQHRTDVDQFERWLGEQRSRVAGAEGRIAQLEQDLREARLELRARVDELSDRRAAESELRTRLEETRQRFAEKEAGFKQEFEMLANRVFEHQGQQHQVRLDAVLAPLRDQLGDFRQRVEKVYDAETRDRASLLAEVRNLQQASDRINKEAENLSRALKGDVKAQGNWGEMVLERVLEASGLRAGEEYFVQRSYRDDAGFLKRPDVLIRLPDDKDVVVDAKLSLLAYEEALALDDDGARAEALTRHVASLRAHVRRLADQDYDRLADVRSLDFVLLFVPIEAAFTLAMEHDQRLFTEAFERRIVIVSPTTLMMTLRIIHNVWRYEKQNRNAQEIARRAGALYDKFRGLVEDMETLGRQLKTAEATFEQVFAKLSSGKGNLLRRVETFRELGAPVRKALPPHLLNDDDLDDFEDEPGDDLEDSPERGEAEARADAAQDPAGSRNGT